MSEKSQDCSLPEQPELALSEARELYQQHPRLRKVYRIARDLLCLNEHYELPRKYQSEERRQSASAWSQVGELAIDSRFFFAFDPIWRWRVRTIRQQFLGHEEIPFAIMADAQAWYRSLDERQRDEFDQKVNDLTGEFGLLSSDDVGKHVLFGQDLWIPAARIETEPAPSHPAPAITIYIYSAAELRGLISQAPLLFRGLDTERLLNSLPHAPNDLRLFDNFWKEPGRSLKVKTEDEMWESIAARNPEETMRLAKEIEAEAARKRADNIEGNRSGRLQPPMTPEVRIRTWACYYMSTDGGGPLQWGRGQMSPLKLWVELLQGHARVEGRRTEEYWPKIQLLLSQQWSWRSRTASHWQQWRLMELRE